MLFVTFLQKKCLSQILLFLAIIFLAQHFVTIFFPHKLIFSHNLCHNFVVTSVITLTAVTLVLSNSSNGHFFTNPSYRRTNRQTTRLPELLRAATTMAWPHLFLRTILALGNGHVHMINIMEYISLQLDVNGMASGDRPRWRDTFTTKVGPRAAWANK